MELSKEQQEFEMQQAETFIGNGRGNNVKRIY